MTPERQLRVALCAPLPPPPGGIGRWAERLIAHGQAHGIDYQVVDTSPKGTEMGEKSRFRTDRAVRNLAMVGQLAGVLRRGRLDACHIATSLYWASARDTLFVTACRTAKVPVILHVHGSTHMVQWHERLPRPLRQAVDRMLRSTDRLVVLSQESEAYFARAVPGLQIVRLPNLVETDVPPGPLVLPPRTAPVRVLFVGYVIPTKGVTELARAVLALPDVELVLVGAKGEAQDPVQLAGQDRALDDLHRAGRLHVAGELAPEATLHAYREADVFALPSWREGQPNVLLEAMAAGLPCVVTPVGGIPDVVGPDKALVVPVGDVPALTQALRRLAADPGLRKDLGQRGRDAITAEYGVETVMGRLRSLYLEVARR